MTSVPCIHNDGGLCTIPDPSAVVAAGRVDIRSRVSIEDTYPQFDPKQARLVTVDIGGLPGVETLARGTSASAAAMNAALVNAAENASMTAGILVLCSCGHTLIGEAGTAEVAASAEGELVDA